jgi:phospholipase C
LSSGQRFIKTLVQELMRSPYWTNSAFLLMYDDWGGWYDHVNPPQVDAYGYGLRVPGLLVSAYAKKGYVDNTELDFTSILKFIEHNWGVQSLTSRDANANNFLEAFDFNKPPRAPVFISGTRDTGVPKKAVPVQVIYLFYGAALTVAFFFIVFAGIRSAVISRRRRVYRSSAP